MRLVGPRSRLPRLFRLNCPFRLRSALAPNKARLNDNGGVKGEFGARCSDCSGFASRNNKSFDFESRAESRRAVRLPSGSTVVTKTSWKGMSDASERAS